MQNSLKLFSDHYSSSSRAQKSLFQSTSTSTTKSVLNGVDNVTAVPITRINNKYNKNKAHNLMTATGSLVLDDEDNNVGEDIMHLKQPRTFLECEIVDCQDFILALSVGLLVGSSIVFGFLLGILHVTTQYPIDTDGNLISVNGDDDCSPSSDVLNEKIETIEVVNEAMELLKQ